MTGRDTRPQSFFVLTVALCLAIAPLAATQRGAYDGAVRLIGGSSLNEGHVEIHFQGVWGAVCDHTWDIADGNTVCHQLGFPGAKVATLNSYFPFSSERSDMITLTDTHCSGSEPSLALCPNSSWVAGGCNSSHHAGVICEDPLDYSVRLSVTEKENRGYLEVSLSGRWLRVLADETWDLSQAELVCSALGFQYATSAGPVVVFEGQDAYPDMRNFTSLRCWVVEGNHRICNSSAPLGTGSDSGASEDTGMTPLEIQCNAYQLTLEGHSNPLVNTATLIVHNNTKVHSPTPTVICDDEWTLADAVVACRQLGFAGADATSYQGHPLALSNVYKLDSPACNGEEISVEQCGSSRWRRGPCPNGTSAAVRCTSPAVTIESLTAINASSIHVQWTVDNLPQAHIITGYTLKLFTATTDPTFMLHPAKRFNHVLQSGLMPYTEYTVMIRVETVHGEGEWSDGRRITTLSSVPEIQPIVCNTSSTYPRSISITVKPASQYTQVNGEFQGYVVEYRATGSQEPTQTLHLPANLGGTVIAIGGLQTFTEYSMRLAVWNDVGVGPFTVRFNVTTEKDVPEVQPTVSAISSPSPRNISIAVKPASQYTQVNGEFQGYVVEYRADGSQEPARTLHLSASLSDTVIAIGGLQTFTEYSIRLAVWNDVGVGPFTPPFNVTTQEDVPSSVPTFNATAQSPTAVALSWEEPMSPNGFITSFVCHYVSVSKGISHEGEKNFSGTTRKGTLNELEEYVRYRLTMYATTVKGRGEGNEAEFITTLAAAPAEPLEPVAAPINSTAILLSWEPPSLINRNGPNISYVVEYGWSGGVKEVVYSTDTSELIGGLSPYIPYQFKVAAVSADNETGAFTESFSGNITRTPSPVLNLTVSSVQDRTCLLTWAAPQWTNGNFEYYSIRLYGDVVHHTVNSTSTDVRYSCKELEEGIHYNVSVAAVSEHGEGKQSYTDFTTSISRPGASPTWVNLISVSHTALTVYWQPPSIRDQNGPVTSYRIRYHITGSARVKYITEMVSVDPSLSLNESWQFNYTVVKLSANTEYSVAVAAENAQGEGPYSLEEVIRLPETPTTATNNTGSTVVAVVMVLLILTIALIAAAVSLYLCVKWKQLKSHFEHHFKWKDCNRRHIYEEPKCPSVTRSTSIENIYDVCGTPGRLSIQEEDYPEICDGDEPTQNDDRMLFTGYPTSATCTSDGVHSWASLPDVMSHPNTPDFLDNPLYEPRPTEIADQLRDLHSTAGRLAGSLSHGTKSSTLPRQNPPRPSAGMAFTEPVTMSHLEQQEQHYDLLAPYSRLSHSREPHSAPSTLSPGFVTSEVYAHPEDKFLYQNITNLAPLQEDNDSVDEFDYVHVYDVPRKGRATYAVPRSCIATIGYGDNDSDSPVRSAVVLDPNSDQDFSPASIADRVPEESESETQR